VIPVIDLFAGPGGLGEGFASRLDHERRRIFKIALSIEMNSAARTTLRLRSFFRQFESGHVPDEYYEVLRGQLSLDELYKRYPAQSAASHAEAWQAELGKTDQGEVDRRIRTALRGATNWVLIGGPPCQAYSLVGRSRVINVDREKYEQDGRHKLYEQYLRILRVHKPKSRTEFWSKKFEQNIARPDKSNSVFDDFINE
jgi:DNA (cytosine-5)-methyltransferase 1